MVQSKWLWRLDQFFGQVWVKAVSFGVLGIVTALAAAVIKPFVPMEFGAKVGADAVDQILNILASSMLAVTTFSLSIVVGAFGSASGAATPRATELLRADGTTQQVLANFIGAFLFSLVGIIALKTGVYGEQGRLILFVVTIFVLAGVVMTILRWIAHIMHFGRLGHTLDMLETATTQALQARFDAPYLGGRALEGPLPSGLNRITSDRVGYVQHIELSVLSELAEATDQDIYLECLPGSFVSAGGVLGVGGALTDAQQAKARAAFTIDITRTFAQDPRFGLIALGETADKALSPGINDPGTAIDVIGRFVRIFSVWKDARPSPPLVHPRLHIRPLDPADMFDDAFRPIARDGAGLIEVQVRLQKAYLALAMAAPETLGPVAVQHAHESLARSLEHLTLPRERATVQQAFDEVRAVLR